MTEQELLLVIERAAKDQQLILDLSNQQLTSLPSEIGQLQDLVWLNISNNSLTDLPPEIGNLKNLTSLDLGNNLLTSKKLPSELWKLQNLTSLDLNGNRLSSISTKISQLQSLTRLDLSNNKLRKLPTGITQLTCLTWLYLRKNNLKHLGEEISQLENLNELHLSDNQLKELPTAIFQLKSLTELDLQGNPFKMPAQTLAKSQEPDFILEKYRQLQEKEHIIFESDSSDKQEEYCYEAKLVILGERGSGKTTLAKKIINPDYQLDLSENSTTGINVNQWTFDLENKKQFRVNIWDFSGQDIDHNTHQFFLTEKTLYVLVSDDRRDNKNFPYWLNIVRLRGKNSPILIIKNEKQDHPCQTNDSQLRGQFLNLEKILQTNLETDRGLSEIIEAIRQHVYKLPHVGDKISKKWIRVRQVLEKHPQGYISLRSFYQICQEKGITKQQDKDDLIKYLNTVGVCHHFRDELHLKGIIFLQPEWITDAVHKISRSPKTFT